MVKLVEFAKEEFDVDMTSLEAVTDKSQTQKLYNGINQCNQAHKGITVAKLVHAVVC